MCALRTFADVITVSIKQSLKLQQSNKKIATEFDLYLEAWFNVGCQF